MHYQQNQKQRVAPRRHTTSKDSFVSFKTNEKKDFNDC